VALPTDMFFNTGIATYIWILCNHKPVEGKVQLTNAVDEFSKMRKALGSKRNYFTDEHIKTIIGLYGEFEASERCKIFDSTDFGYRRITVERPLQLSFFPKKAENIEGLKYDKAFSKWSEALK